MTDREFEQYITSVIKEYGANYINEELIDNTPHKFSPEFERKMDILIGRSSKKLRITPKRLLIAITAALLAVFIIAVNVSAVREAFIRFITERFSTHTEVQTIPDDTAPETIENIYAITYELHDYEIIYENYNDYIRNITYKNGDLVIDYFQYVKFAYDVHLNTEGADIETLLVNGTEMIYYKDNHEYNNLIWDNGDYIISISSNVSKDELIDIANSVQKVE